MHPIEDGCIAQRKTRVFSAMMTGMREASKGVVGKIIVGILMSLLILSFAVWGINDVFQGGGTSNVAVVGNEKITQAEYVESYRRLLLRVQRERGISPTTAQMRAEGMDRRLLESMIGDAALSNKAAALGLSYNVTDAARSITTDPRFQQGGTFSRDMFNGFLQNANLSEAMYLRELANATLRNHVSAAVAAEGTTPAVIAEVFHKRANEERSIAFVKITEASIPPVSTPDDATLKTYFETNQSIFRAPEYRALNYIAINPASFEADLVIDEADIKKEFDEGLAAGRYGSPEKRSIQQLTFPTKDAASAALGRARAGTTFDALAVELNQLGTFDAGSRSKADIGIASLADPIFMLAPNTISEPIESGGQFVLARVTAITPAVIPVLDDELKTTIEDSLRQARLANDPAIKKKVEDFHESVEELRGNGKTLAEIGKEKSLALVAVPAIDAAGRDKAEKALAIPEAQRFLTAIYGSAPGVDNEAIATSDKGWIWFEMTGREEARNLTFEEGKAKALQRWTNEEKAKRIAARSDELLKKRQTGQTLQQIATEISGTVETQSGLKRFAQPFGPEAGTAIFVTPPNTSGIASVSLLEKLLFDVTASTTPPLDAASEQSKQTDSMLGTLLAEDIVTQYVAGIQSASGVSINEAALNAAIGAQ
jgi:peptidyl-prolyl cis-trans isomerase D